MIRYLDVDNLLDVASIVLAVAAGRLTEVPDIARELRKLYL